MPCLMCDIQPQIIVYTQRENILKHMCAYVYAHTQTHIKIKPEGKKNSERDTVQILLVFDRQFKVNIINTLKFPMREEVNMQKQTGNVCKGATSKMEWKYSKSKPSLKYVKSDKGVVDE